MTSLNLHPNHWITPCQGPLVVIVLDGVGIGREDSGDAVYLARTPTLDHLDRVALKTTLRAHGVAVGMPSDNDMGNSEVGHNAIGAGRIFDQGAKLVSNAFSSQSLFASPTWNALLQRTSNDAKGTLHLLGLLSDGNVHSHIDHLFEMLSHADQDGVSSARVHILLDGRDVAPHSALEYVEPLEALLAKINKSPHRDYQIASGGGRMITTMDRYNADWSIVERGWNAHVKGDARHFSSTTEAIETLRKENPKGTDQNLPPFVITNNNDEPVGPMRDGDAVVFFNFRGDRAIQITRAFEEDDFNEFPRGPRPDLLYTGMMQYDGDLHLPQQFLVAPPIITHTLGELLAHNNLQQLAISETQKFGHVTYFWNGNRSKPFNPELETYIEIPSDKVDFAERPWMKAAEVTDALIAELHTKKYHHARVNYANGDMVGHTGGLDAAIIAVEVVDLCLQRVLEAIDELQGIAIITADHGNADQMFYTNPKKDEFKLDAQGQRLPMTSHTLNAVPFWIYDPNQDKKYTLNPTLNSPGLANIAATVLELMGYEAPAEYERSLITPILPQ